MMLLTNVCLSFVCLGFGVFAMKHFEKGDFLLEYVGEFVDPHNTNENQEYMYYFNFKRQQFWYVPVLTLRLVNKLL